MRETHGIARRRHDVGTPAQLVQLQQLYEQPCRSDAQVHETIALFHDTGAIEHSRERIAQLWSQTHKASKRWGSPPPNRKAFVKPASAFCRISQPNGKISPEGTLAIGASQQKEHNQHGGYHGTRHGPRQSH